MKKFKAIVPALAMLLVSAVLLGTSTFAWFSMNDNVSVSGMQITAASDQQYLIIGTSSELTDLQDKTNGNKISVELKNDSEDGALAATVKPVQPKANAITDATSAALETNWEWYKGTAMDNGTANGTAGTVADLDDYTLHTTVYITVAKNTPDAADLILEEATFAKVGSESLDGFGGVIVATEEGADRYDSDNAVKARGAAGKTVLASTVTASKAIKVDIYVYVYGANANITTQNAVDLATLSLTLKFSVK